MNPILETAASKQKDKAQSEAVMYDVTVRWFPLVRYSKLVDLHIQIWPLKELGILKTQQSHKKPATRPVE
jgi:hypothetical protein